MKIICTDNYDRDSAADTLIAEHVLNKEEGTVMVEALNKRFKSSQYYYTLVEDSYRLKRGMADLV